MRYDQCQKYFDIYIKNSEKCSLATFVCDDKLAARALVWRGVEEYEDTVFFDRIYAHDHSTYLEMMNHLKGLGYKDLYSLKDDKSYSIKLANWDHRYYPYMDSFRWATEGTFNTDSGRRYEREYCDTDGKWGSYDGDDDGDDDRVICPCCEERTDEEVHTIVAGGYQHDMLCDSCCTYSDYHDGYIWTGNATETPNDWVLDSVLVSTVEGGEWGPDDEGTNWVTINGSNHDLDQDEMTKVDGNWMWNKDLVEEEER